MMWLKIWASEKDSSFVVINNQALAFAVSGDTAKAKATYQDFLTLWKDADPDIPILKEAKAEYSKLR